MARSVRYGEQFGQSELKMLEVDEALLQELLHYGLTIKGGEDEEAVLCSSSKTYAVKFVSTSNTLLLIPPSSTAATPSAVDDYDVAATSGGHLELVEVAPRLDRLRELISRNPYTDEATTMSDETLFTLDELEEQMQASKQQVSEGLKALDAVQVDGRWRTVDPTYMQSLLEVLALTAIQQEWSLSALPLDAMVGLLEQDGYSGELVRQALSNFALEAPSPSSSSILRLDETKIWKQAVPSGLQVCVDMLRGEALISRLGSDSWLHRFSASSLSKKPAERFTALFRERPKWEWTDLEPYLRDLRIPGLSVEAMLLKFTRKIQPTADSAPVYTSR